MTNIPNRRNDQLLGYQTLQIRTCWNPAIFDNFSYFEDQTWHKNKKNFQ